MKNVAYYTSTNFLDVIVETIQSIKNDVNLYLFIEITNNSKNCTIINVDQIDNFKFLEDPINVFGENKWNEIKHYFTGLADFKFIVYKNKKSISANTLVKGIVFLNHLKNLKIEIIHFDTISNRAMGYIFFLNKYKTKIIICLHDAIPHIGEDSWKEKIAIVLFYKRASSFIFYSNYSLHQFETIYKKLKTSTYKIKLQPYTINKVKQDIKIGERKHILFFGRLSFYKGIDILLKAIPIVLKTFPNEMFLIAGKSVYDCKIDYDQINNYKNNIQLINEFIPNEKLIEYINESKFVVCPYRDASQSGVLMTSKAIGRTIVATNTGAFSEYVNDNYDGILCEPNKYDLAEKIISLLINEKYKTLEKNIIKQTSEKDRALNKLEILKAYSN